MEPTGRDLAPAWLRRRGGTAADMRQFTRLIVGQDRDAIGIEQVVRHADPPLRTCGLSGPIPLEVLSLTIDGELGHPVFHFLGQPQVFLVLLTVREGRKVEALQLVFRP